MTTDAWMPIPDFPGYEAAPDGRIRSRKRGDPQELKLGYRNGYRVVTIKDAAGKRQTPGVHRLVLLAFVGPPSPEQRVCRHLDGNREHNAVENLRWGTHAENTADAIAHGTHARSIADRTACGRGHEYTPETTRINAEGHRECRICALARRWAKNPPPTTRTQFGYAIPSDVLALREAS